jgi:hypothetical protein
MTEDEYSGYKFEELFTSDQPNTTRREEKIPFEKPQEGFHTVQYWQFGQFNILYSNEIDGEIKVDLQPKQETTNTTKPVSTSTQFDVLNEKFILGRRYNKSNNNNNGNFRVGYLDKIKD